MRELVVVSFDHFDDARNALKSLRSLERSGRIRFEDTALIERDPDGTAHVKNEVSGTTEKLAVVGALIGGLLTFVFPIAGIVVGGAVGAAFGASMDTGANSDFIADVKTTLRPGRSALMLVVNQSDVDSLIPTLGQFKGDVLQTTLPSETEDALRAALE